MSQSPVDEDLDLMLVEKILHGLAPEKRASQEKLYKRWFPVVVYQFSKKGFSPEDCEDLTQEAFWRVFNGIGEFRGQRFAAWLFTITASVYKNEIRKRHAKKREAKEKSLEQALEENPSELAKSHGIGSSPERDVLDGIVELERLKVLRRAFKVMPHQMRMCCYYRYLRGKKYREIAVLMKISIGTVKAHLAQARKRLIEEFGIELGPELGG